MYGKRRSVGQPGLLDTSDFDALSQGIASFVFLVLENVFVL
jgi:hypothetical protein